MVVTGTGPPGPPRRRGCEVVLAGEELVVGFCFGRVAESGEDISKVCVSDRAGWFSAFVKAASCRWWWQSRWARLTQKYSEGK